MTFYEKTMSEYTKKWNAAMNRFEDEIHHALVSNSFPGRGILDRIIIREPKPEQDWEHGDIVEF